MRRSARLQGKPAEFAGIGVPLPVDLTNCEDDHCSFCGFADGRVVNSPCCGIPVHSECAHGGCLNCGEVPNFDVEFGDDISEDMFSDCVICACAQDASNSLLLPCCGNRHRVHTGCLVRSVEFCGLRCPFCATYLDASHPSLSALRALDPSSVPANAELASVVHNVQLPPEPHIRTLCCHRVGPYPFWTTGGWSGLQLRLPPVVVHGSRSGCVEVVQGQRRRATFLPLVPFHAILAKDQQVSSSMQFLEHFSTSVLHVGNQLLEGCILGSHKVLFVFLGSLYGWGDSPPSLSGVGTQSWFFCPLISVALGAVELSRGVSMYEFGRRSPVPDDQVAFWTQQAPDLLNAFVQHFAALSVDDPVMTALQSEHAWVGGHLVDSLQLAATPQHIQSLMELWLANAVSSFATPTAVSPPALASLVSPLSPPPADVPPAATSPPATSSGAPALAPVLPAPSGPFWPTIASPAHAHPPALSPVASAQVSHRAPHLSRLLRRRPLSVHTTLPKCQVLSHLVLDLSVRACPSAQPVPAVESEFGPSRLTRFLEMPLDRYVNVLTSMINNGRFSHILHAVIRLEGQTAWGVWLRINRWDSSQGRRARLRVGVLYHVANRTLSFHGSATAVLPIVVANLPGLDLCDFVISSISVTSGRSCACRPVPSNTCP